MKVTKLHSMLLMCMLAIAILMPACTGPETTPEEPTSSKLIANVSAWEAYPNIAQAAEQTLNIRVTDTKNVGIAGAACIANLVHTDSGASQVLDFPATDDTGGTKVMFKTDPSQFARGKHVANITCIVPGIGEQHTQSSFIVE